jgi:anhydro-N-acetylmuramic acid kinase
MAEIQKIIGLMSGTSLDGIDAALLETDGEAVARPGLALAVPYAPELRALLKETLLAVAAIDTDAPPPAIVAEAEAAVTAAHAAAVALLLREAGLSRKDVSLVGFHGQTIRHRPKERHTWQIGDGAALARAAGIPVVNDFRSQDVLAGGQGAPLVPLYHRALALSAGLEEPVAIVNIGGVANVTYINGEEILAFDTGPGNAPLDDWAMAHIGEPVDRDGAMAAKGHVDEAILDAMLHHEFFDRVPPKSLDRLDFGVDAVKDLSPEDGAATLAAFTAAAIARSAAHFPLPPRRWIVCGGGRHNPVLMENLRRRVNAPVSPAEAVGWQGDFLEAEAFAYLAARSAKGLPLSLPSTTGVPHPMPGGRLHRPAA